MTDECSTCFFVRSNGDGLSCQFYPPSAVAGNAAWPSVPSTQWCGHFSTDGDTVGPAGPQGPQGETGATRPTGPAGAGADYVVPLGGMIPYTCPTVPNSNFVFPYGQALSRATYASYFALVGETYGPGDGLTTFNVIDMRGRVAAGLDNMGGSSANRLTTPINGDNLGAAGGAESVASSAQTVTTTGGTFDAAAGTTFNAFSAANPTGTPGAATSVVQPTIIVPWLLRVL